jgi:threonine/homoserine/homoserine lactone efflux protein
MRIGGNEKQSAQMSPPLDLWLSALTGLISGFVVSMPLGPINVTVINDAAHRGFWHAWVVGLGAVTMDLVYCAIALAGLSGLFASAWVKAVMELISFLLLGYLGWRYWHARDVPTTSVGADLMERRFHPHAAFLIGLVRVLGNPGILILWISVTAMLFSHQWIVPTLAGKAMCLAGVAVGGSTWFFALSYGVSRGHGRFSTRTLLRLSHVSGACLLAGALLIAFRIVRLLAHH